MFASTSGRFWHRAILDDYVSNRFLTRYAPWDIISGNRQRNVTQALELVGRAPIGVWAVPTGPTGVRGATCHTPMHMEVVYAVRELALVTVGIVIIAAMPTAQINLTSAFARTITTVTQPSPRSTESLDVTTNCSRLQNPDCLLSPLVVSSPSLMSKLHEGMRPPRGLLFCRT